MERKISEISNLVSKKISSSLLNTNIYISTENLLPNFGGITTAASIPDGNVTAFQENDILLSNIRPYFKKIWFSKFEGGCSNDVLVIRANHDVLNKYLFYALNNEDFINYYVASCKGTKMPRGNKDALLDWRIDVPSISEQQHIVNTIGSVDDLIENYQLQIKNLMSFGLTKINALNDSKEHYPLSNISKFEKGIEIGSSNYIEKEDDDLIYYLRVGDLLSISNTFIYKEIAQNNAIEDDILVAFDGAPGRNNIGLSGSFSSGIYKVLCDGKYKGLIFFEINSRHNQKIITDHSQGTTILHASKAIQYLEYSNCDDKDLKLYNNLFNRLVSLKKQIALLQQDKKTLLNKYFTK